MPEESRKPTTAEAMGWLGADLAELGGNALGQVQGFFVDAEDGEPAWLVARLGRRRRARVVAVPFANCAGAPFGVWVAQEADAHLTVLYVLGDEEDVTPDAYGAILMNDLESLAALRKRHEEDARKRLAEAVPPSVAAYCSVETMVSSGGKPSREILRIANEQQTDLIVVGVQGRGAANVMFFGSTTNHVVREATCPVLTIRRP